MKITIPTSVAGVSILPSGISGPLAKLFGSKFSKETLTYPKNLGNDTARKHYIELKIFKTVAKTAQVSGTLQPATLKNTVEAATKIASDATLSGVAGDIYQGMTKAPTNEVASSTIALYIPDSVKVSYKAEYSDVSLTSALGTPYFMAQAGASFGEEVNKILKGGINANSLKNAVASNPYAMVALGKLIGNVAGGKENASADLLLRGVGRALNPQIQLLFKQVDLRTFSFDFTLTPYSKEEAEDIKKIVKALKRASAPEIDKSTSINGTGMFYKIPDQVEVRFMYDGKENNNVHKIARCVIEGIDVDYAPMGWITFNDGNPVQTKLSLKLKEIEIIDKTKMDEGNY